MIGMRVIEAEQLQAAFVRVLLCRAVLLRTDEEAPAPFFRADVLERQHLVDHAVAFPKHRTASLVWIRLRTVLANRRGGLGRQRQRSRSPVLRAFARLRSVSPERFG